MNGSDDIADGDPSGASDGDFSSSPLAFSIPPVASPPAREAETSPPAREADESPPAQDGRRGGRTSADASFKRHRLLRGGATVMVGTILQKAVNLVFFAVFARALSRGHFDAFIYATAFGVFFETFSDFGLDFVVTRELNQRPEAEHGRIVGTAMVAKVFVFSVTFGLAALTALIKPEYRGVAMVATLGIFCGIPGTLGLALRARLRPVGPEVITTLSALATAIALIIAVESGASVLVLVTTQVALRVASSILMVPWLRSRLHYRLRADMQTARSLLRGAAPVALSTFAVIVYARVDQLMLGVIGKPGELGGYAVAVRVVEAINFIPVAIGAIALPTFSHLEGYDEERFRRLSERGIRYLALIIFPLAVLATVAGGALLATLFGPRFRSEGAALAVLVWAHFFASSWVLARPILIARHRANYLSALAVIAAVVDVGLNLWLIPRYGGLGAAWASLISYSSPFVAALFMPAVRDSFAAPLRAAIRPVVALAVVLAILLVLPSAPLVKLAVFAVLAPGVLLASKSVTVREVRDLALSVVRGR